MMALFSEPGVKNAALLIVGRHRSNRWCAKGLLTVYDVPKRKALRK